MKKNYQPPEIIKISVDLIDILTTSPGNNELEIDKKETGIGKL